MIGVSGVTHVLLYIGVNDPTNALQPATATIAVYQSLVARLHANGIKVIMTTVTSTVGEAGIGGTGTALADYAEVNRYIRTSGLFDSVVGFNPATGDQDQDTAVLFPRYAAHSTTDSNPDFLHQGRAGMQAEANTLDISVLRPAGF